MITNYKKQHKRDFDQWKIGRNIQQTSERTSLKVGDNVTFTNEFGVSFEDNEILGFDLEDFYGRFIYLDKDSYWFPVTEKSLIKV